MKNKVKDIMSANVITLHKDTPYTVACRFFHEFNIHHVPVTDENHKVVGVFSSTDALRGYTDNLIHLYDLSTNSIDDVLKVDEMMSDYKLYTILSDATIKQAADLMQDKNVHSLLIMDNDNISGIVTNTDILNHCSSNW